MSKWDRFKKPELTNSEIEELYDMAVRDGYHSKDEKKKRIERFFPYIRAYLKEEGKNLKTILES